VRPGRRQPTSHSPAGAVVALAAPKHTTTVGGPPYLRTHRGLSARSRAHGSSEKAACGARRPRYCPPAASSPRPSIASVACDAGPAAPVRSCSPANRQPHSVAAARWLRTTAPPTPRGGLATASSLACARSPHHALRGNIELSYRPRALATRARTEGQRPPTAAVVLQ
jgi:hypothetical protein